MPWHRRENNIKMDLKEIGCEGGDWVQQAQDRIHLANCCEHSNEP
jgi:hypothetical protein